MLRQAPSTYLVNGRCSGFNPRLLKRNDAAPLMYKLNFISKFVHHNNAYMLQSFVSKPVLLPQHKLTPLDEKTLVTALLDIISIIAYKFDFRMSPCMTIVRRISMLNDRLRVAGAGRHYTCASKRLHVFSHYPITYGLC